MIIAFKFVSGTSCRFPKKAYGKVIVSAFDLSSLFQFFPWCGYIGGHWCNYDFDVIYSRILYFQVQPFAPSNAP